MANNPKQEVTRYRILILVSAFLAAGISAIGTWFKVTLLVDVGSVFCALSLFELFKDTLGGDATAKSVKWIRRSLNGPASLFNELNNKISESVNFFEKETNTLRLTIDHESSRGVYITSHQTNESVQRETRVSGMYSINDAKIYVLIRPAVSTRIYVQSQVEKTSDKDWRCNCIFGSVSSKAGEEFEVMVVANPDMSLDTQGENPLASWPEAEYRSHIILIKLAPFA